MRVDGNRTGAGGVDADADDLVRSEATLFLRLSERALHASFQADEIVAGMLAGEIVVFGIEEDALLAARVIHNMAAHFLAVGTPDDEAAHRVGAVVNS